MGITLKNLATAGMAIAAVYASAQIVPTETDAPISENMALARTLLNTGLSGVRDLADMHIRLTGTVKLGIRMRRVQVDAYRQVTADLTPDGLRKTAKFELAEQVEQANGAMQLVRRTVGDGLYFTHYDLNQQTVTSFQYGSYSGPQNAEYMARFLELTSATPTLYAGYVLRLMRDATAGTEARYSDWLSGTEPVISNLGVTYARAGNGISRSFGFSMATADGGPVTAFSGSDQRMVGNELRSFVWDAAFVADTGAYTPYLPYDRQSIAGWRTLPWTGLSRLRSGG
jgi:hypothetical protein